MKKKPESGLDIGRVHRFKKMPNGDIHGYFRVAVADQPLQYLNRDGSICLVAEVGTRSDL